VFAAYLHRAEESVLGRVMVETTILYMATRHNSSQVLQDAASVYRVDTAAIALQVKQDFAAKEKTQTAKNTVAKIPPKAVKKAKAAFLEYVGKPSTTLAVGADPIKVDQGHYQRVGRRLVKASATATWGSNFKGGVHLKSSLREQNDHAKLFRRTMFPVQSGVECLLPKHKDYRLKVYRRTFQSWRSGHRQAVWKPLQRFCVLSPLISRWHSF
jgi:hypothetical protein